MFRFLIVGVVIAAALLSGCATCPPPPPSIRVTRPPADPWPTCLSPFGETCEPRHVSVETFCTCRKES